MSVPYTDSFVYPGPRLVVALRHVESMEFQDEEGTVADRLKDDITIKIITISGKEYTLSTVAHYKNYTGRTHLDEYARGIYERWRFLMEK